MKRICVWMVVVAGLLIAGAADARAQSTTFGGYFTPFVGATFGGDVADPVFTVGASVSVHEESGWGAELDLGYANDTNAQNREADLTSVMVNLKWMRPQGHFRPFAAGGAGLVTLHGCLSNCPNVITANDFGLSAGGGVYYTLTDIIGFRGDARYIWAPGSHPTRPDNYGFWRATFGITLMWAIVP